MAREILLEAWAEHETDSRLRSGIPSAAGQSDARKRKLSSLVADQYWEPTRIQYWRGSAI